MHFCTDKHLYRHRDTQTYRWPDKQADRQTYSSVHRGRQPDSRQTGKQAVRQSELQTERQEGWKERRRAEMQKCRNAGRKTDRGTEDRCIVQIYIQTNRNKDVQTYTDKQTVRRTVQKCWNRLYRAQDPKALSQIGSIPLFESSILTSVA